MGVDWKPEKMDKVDILTSQVQNISLGDSEKLRKNEEAFRRNQDIFTEKKVSGEKIINTSESNVETARKPKKASPPCFKLRTETEVDILPNAMSALKLRDRLVKSVARNPARIYCYGPGPDAVLVPGNDRADDDLNPAKARRQNRSPEGPVDTLDTPAANEVPEITFPFEHAPMSPYYATFSPADSGYADSPPPELPTEVEDIINKFFLDGEFANLNDVENKLTKFNMDESLVHKVISKIDTFIQELKPAVGKIDNAAEPAYQNEGIRFDSPALLETSLDGFSMQFVDPNEVTAPPSSSPPIPTTVDACPVTSTPPANASSKRSVNTDTRKPDPKQALQEMLKVRTDTGCLGGSTGVGRQMSDLSSYVQNLSATEKNYLEECRTIIANMSDGDCLKVSEGGDTMLHNYVIFSPEKDAPDYPPRRKMKFLVFCLLERLDAMKKLVGSGGLLNRKNDKGQTPLYLAACVVNFPEAVHMFLHYGADPNVRRATKGMDGPTPLHKIMERGDDCLAVLSHLLSNSKCDPNILNSDGLTPLMIAHRAHRTQYRNPDTSAISCVSTIKCVQMLLTFEKVDRFATSASSGRTALHYAVEKGDVELVRAWHPFAGQPSPVELTAQKTPCKLINITDRDGNTVLHILAGLQLDKRILANMARQLIAMGADVTKRNGEKKIARELAKNMKHTELAELLQMPKPRRTSNTPRQRNPIQSQSSDDSNVPDFSQSFSSQSSYSFGGSFQGVSDDSSHSYSPPSVFQVVCEPSTTTSYVPNGMFTGQNIGFGLSGGQAIVTTQFGFAGVVPQAQYTSAGIAPHQGRVSPPENHFVPTTVPNTLPSETYQHSPLNAGHYQQHSPLGASYNAGGHSPLGALQQGGHSPQGGYSPAAQYVHASPGHSTSSYQGSPHGHMAPDAFAQQGLPAYTGQYVSPTRHSPTLSPLTNVTLQPYTGETDKIYHID